MVLLSTGHRSNFLIDNLNYVYLPILFQTYEWVMFILVASPHAAKAHVKGNFKCQNRLIYMPISIRFWINWLNMTLDSTMVWFWTLPLFYRPSFFLLSEIKKPRSDSKVGNCLSLNFFYFDLFIIVVCLCTKFIWRSKWNLYFEIWIRF